MYLSYPCLYITLRLYHKTIAVHHTMLVVGCAPSCCTHSFLLLSSTALVAFLFLAQLPTSPLVNCFCPPSSWPTPAPPAASPRSGFSTIPRHLRCLQGRRWQGSVRIARATRKKSCGTHKKSCGCMLVHLPQTLYPLGLKYQQCCFGVPPIYPDRTPRNSSRNSIVRYARSGS